MTKETLTKSFLEPLYTGSASSERGAGYLHERGQGSVVSPFVRQKMAMRAFLMYHGVLIQNATSVRQTGIRN